jgi:hypothetical protein
MGLQDILDSSETWFKETFAQVSDTKMALFFAGWVCFLVGTTVWVFREDRKLNERVNDEKIKAEAESRKSQ